MRTQYRWVFMVPGVDTYSTMNQITHRGLGINDSYENGSEILPNNSDESETFTAIEFEIFQINNI